MHLSVPQVRERESYRLGGMGMGIRRGEEEFGSMERGLALKFFWGSAERIHFCRCLILLAQAV